VSPTEVTGRDDLLPTMIDEGLVELDRRRVVRLLTSEVVWLKAPKSMTKSVTVRGVKGMILKELASDC
jgi:hypothetical protein